MTEVRIDELALHELLNDEHGEVAQDLQRRALAVEETQKRLLSIHGTGVLYKRRGRVHQASAPGEPPAPDTGLLRATVGHSLHHDEAGDLVADIGSGANPEIPGVNYAVYLELGTRHMAPRPWLRPSIDAARE